MLRSVPQSSAGTDLASRSRGGSLDLRLRGAEKVSTNISGSSGTYCGSNIVKNFLLHTMQLQSWEKTVDCYSPGQGLMPASFKVRTVPNLDGNPGNVEEVLDPDFGEAAIGRVAPVDSGLWWIILLRAYGKITGDYALQERVDVQIDGWEFLRLTLAWFFVDTSVTGIQYHPSVWSSCLINNLLEVYMYTISRPVEFLSCNIFDDLVKRERLAF